MLNGQWSAKTQQLWENIQSDRAHKQKRIDRASHTKRKRLSPHQLRRLAKRRREAAALAKARAAAAPSSLDVAVATLDRALALVARGGK